MTEQTKTPRTDLIVAELNIEPSESVRYARMERHATALERELATQSALLADMREALEFYANPSSWATHRVGGGGDTGPVEYECPVHEDSGEQARSALKRAADIGGA